MRILARRAWPPVARPERSRPRRPRRRRCSQSTVPTGGDPGRTGLDLLHLVELELDGDLALEDRDEHLQLPLVLVDLGDLAVEVGQVAGRDLHAVAHGEL